LATHATLCTHNPLGAKGCGEAGTIGAPAAIMNAVVNALSPLGVKDLAMPATPGKYGVPLPNTPMPEARAHLNSARWAVAQESHLALLGRCTDKSLDR